MVHRGQSRLYPAHGRVHSFRLRRGCGRTGDVCYPDLSNDQLRQILRNTARGRGWNPRLGWGILDAAKAVSLNPNALGQHLQVKGSECVLPERRGKLVFKVSVENRGAFDVEKALVVVFNGDPREPAAPEGRLQKPIILVTRQIGHTIGPVRGLHATRFAIELTEKPQGDVWLQVCTLDRHGSDEVDTVRIPINVLFALS